MITSIQCEKCGRIFLYTFYSKSCLCGWGPSDEVKKGIDEVGRKRKNRKNRKKNKGNGKGFKKMTTQAQTRQPVSYGSAVSGRADSWEVEIDQVHECSKVPKDQKILIDLFAKRKINALMAKYPSIEWLAYLLGDREKDPYTVKDIFIPQQEVTATTVDKIVCPEFNDLPIIGVIHSHHGMGNGFSGTDHEWINQNHNISLCIAKSGIAGQVRITTPCGALKIIDAVIKVKYPESEFDFNTWIDQETKKIKKPTYNYQRSTYGTGNAWHQGRQGFWQNGVFYPDSQVPSQNGGTQRMVPRTSSQPLSESQKTYSNGVAVGAPEDNDLPTIDEDMSLADALDQVFNETSTTVELVDKVEETDNSTGVSETETTTKDVVADVVEDTSDGKDKEDNDEWSSGLEDTKEAV